MQKTIVDRAVITLVGLAVRTNNRAEMNPETAQIGALVARYHGEAIAERIPGRHAPGVTYVAYTDYASDAEGDYLCLIGEAVTSHHAIPATLQQVLVPAGRYQRFTTPVGPMPNVVITAWQQIWAMSADELGGERAYRTDIELYDERAADLSRACLDIYIGLT